MIASDDAVPPKTDSARIRIQVTRDRLPSFTNLPSSISLSEYQRNDSQVFFVQVRDDDRQGQFEFSFVDAAQTSQLFYIVNSTGQIRIKDAEKLKDDQLQEYALAIKVVDNKRPVTSVATSTLIIRIDRNVYQPKFEQISYRITINDRFGIGQEIIIVKANDRDDDDILRFRSTGLNIN